MPRSGIGLNELLGATDDTAEIKCNGLLNTRLTGLELNALLDFSPCSRSKQAWERCRDLLAVTSARVKEYDQARCGFLVDSELSARRGRHAITAAQILGIEVAVAEMADGLKAGLDTLCNFYEPKPVPKRL